MQYRWSREVRAAESARMKGRLRSSMLTFRHDFYRELASICLPFQSIVQLGTREDDTLVPYAQAYQTWKQSAAHPGLIVNIYILDSADGARPKLLRLDPATGTAAEASPARLGQLPARLAATSSELRAFAEHRGPAPTARRAPRGSLFRHAVPHPHVLGGPWAIEQQIPALVHAILLRRPGAAGGPRQIGFLIIELDAKILKDHLFPELVERHFAGPAGLEYQVAVTTAKGPAVYSSDAAFPQQSVAADAALNLFGVLAGPPPAPRGLLLPGGPETNAPDPPPRVQQLHELGFGFVRFDPLHYSPADQDWQLVAQHRKGSLEAVAASMQRRNLAMSFGVLLVLAATMGVVITVSHRARRLAKLQMDFVSGVSHELRTPLSVISSAADNLADGVVDNPQQLARYGAVIKKQALQLSQLLEQVLLFAATRQSRPPYTIRVLQVQEVIDAALSSTADLIHSAGFTVERSIAPNLPPIKGDLAATSQCLQNLITNAVKYGGADRWIGVRASLDENRGHGGYVRIAVADHGAGIDRSELHDIFDPFYRSPSVTAAQIRGTGLGLTLAKSIAEAMGGRLAVASEPGKGSCFTMYLPVAEQAPAAREAADAALATNSPAK